MDVPEIGVEELAVAHAAGAVVIDVRNPDEFVQSRVPGAVLVPLGEVPDRVAELPTGEPVYVICAVGGRSRRAAAFLRDRGVDAVNVAGGTRAWVAAGRPVDSGEPG